MWYQKRGNKYGAKSTEYGGLTYHSKLEAKYAQELDIRKKAKDIQGWDRQVKIEINAYKNRKGELILTDKTKEEIMQETKQTCLEFFHFTNYYIDFKIYHNDESVEFVEIKSSFTAKLGEWRNKWKMTEAIFAAYPERILTLVM